MSRDRLAALHTREKERFADQHPRSLELSARAREHLLAGVPMHWMTKWAGGFPLFVADARGSRFTDVDGREYVDLCLGDTGAMTGHAPEPTLRALAEQMERGITRPTGHETGRRPVRQATTTSSVTCTCTRSIAACC